MLQSSGSHMISAATLVLLGTRDRTESGIVPVWGKQYAGVSAAMPSQGQNSLSKLSILITTQHKSAMRRPDLQ
jgi:hypothetical protein